MMTWQDDDAMDEAEAALPAEDIDMDVPLDFHHMNPGDDGTLDVCNVCHRHLTRGNLMKHRALNEMIMKLQARSKAHSTSTSSTTGADLPSNTPTGAVEEEDRLLASCAGLRDIEERLRSLQREADSWSGPNDTIRAAAS